MASKQVELADIGPVTLIKRRGNSHIRLSFGRDGAVRISLPHWIPYQAGIEFARSKQDWIIKHRPEHATVFEDKDHIGKAHRLAFARSTNTKPTVRISPNLVTVSYPDSLATTDTTVQQAAERGILKVLKREADQLLPQRLGQLAKTHGFTYKSVTTRRLSSRWGSCSQFKDIVLNIYLMQLPWHLIDYVLIHELVHTEHLDHSARFWLRFEQAMPGAKKLRKELKNYRTAIMPTR